MRIYYDPQNRCVTLQPDTSEEGVALDNLLGFNGGTIPVYSPYDADEQRAVAEVGGHESQRWIRPLS